MSIQEYFGDWVYVIDLKEADRIMKKLSASTHLCPQLKDVFKAFRLCSYNNLRTVIISQDPYPQKGIATGIAFGNKADTPEDKLSPSLEILKESVIDYTVPHRTIIFDPSLEKWESQGVLMLNSALSCEEGRVGIHTLLWRPFIKSLLLKLSERNVGIVYLLMGSIAQSFEPYINKEANFIIKAKHPSWYARQKEIMPSSIWKEINSILIGLNGSGIEWYQEY